MRRTKSKRFQDLSLLLTQEGILYQEKKVSDGTIIEIPSKKYPTWVVAHLWIHDRGSLMVNTHIPHHSAPTRGFVKDQRAISFVKEILAEADPILDIQEKYNIDSARAVTVLENAGVFDRAQNAIQSDVSLCLRWLPCYTRQKGDEDMGWLEMVSVVIDDGITKRISVSVPFPDIDGVDNGTKSRVHVNDWNLISIGELIKVLTILQNMAEDAFQVLSTQRN
jgi:hypothetical protein